MRSIERREENGHQDVNIFIRKESVCEAPPSEPVLERKMRYITRKESCSDLSYHELIFDGVVVLSDGTTPVDRPELEESLLLVDAANRRSGAASVDCLHGGGERKDIGHGVNSTSGRRELGGCWCLWEGGRVDWAKSKETGWLPDGVGLGSDE